MSSDGKLYFDMDMKIFQKKVYNFLERPSRGWICFAYHFMVFLIVLFCLVIGVICTIGEYEEKITQKFIYVETFLLVFFASEYIIRVWSAGCRAKFKGWIGRFHFMRTPISLIDLFVVLASSVVIGFHISGRIGSANPVMAASPALRIIRFFQILRMLHVDRKAHSWKLLLNVAYLHRIELITTMYMGFIVLIVTSYLVYLAERDYIIEGTRPFESYADALWFGIVTVATIGYGDRVPHTWPGRIVTACLSMVGIAFFSLPAGILGSGFALHVQQKEKQKMYHKQYPAAAQLIQAAWRMHATSRLQKDNATWRLYRLVDPAYAEKMLSRSRDNSFLRRRTIMHHSGDSQLPFDSTPLVYKNGIDQLPEKFKQAIRVMRRMKFFVARRKFQEARKPSDMTELVKQTAEDNQALMIRLKDIQRKLDSTLGYVPLSRDNTLLTRTNQSNFSTRSRTTRTTNNPRTGQITVLEHLQMFNERLTLVEQHMNSMTSILQRIDDRMNQSYITK
ncbi:unnamed protein product [Adineta steineri]|uniref:Potassium voltage-gated channel subfamily KQT member 1 n=1 Tax=Adineta steineri TaxID=433720 RepID=A0A818QNK2_9BILA|nr:unnamed protein product [Adineta steineri]CAF0870686.1 unnamed protein product [Adineta steineri]CAF0871240.1 unnamed protein product [Adineta steineri]CAF3503708.1 unnamed protein product [Adineta steineri]CAF3639674.1 unnamed protein product [Adineta steineri]